MIPVPEIPLVRAIEVAESQGWIEPDGSLVIWDCLSSPGGTRMVVSEDSLGQRAVMSDSAQRGCSVRMNGSRVDAVRACLDGYLRIVNVGL